jgi:uncharacterized protein (DUF1697 family)
VERVTARHVAFLRAVNVGKRRVDMARLRDAFVELGHHEVSTYINSGNVVFEPSDASAPLEQPIEAHLAAVFGFEIPTLVRTIDELRTVVAGAMDDLPDGFSQHVVFLRGVPSSTQRAAIESLSGGVDELRVVGREVLWRIQGGVSDSPLTTRHWERVGQAGSTARNATMLVKLLARYG